MPDGDEQASMNTCEIGRKLSGQVAQRFFEKVLAVLVNNGHILLLGAKERNVLERNQLELVALAPPDEWWPAPGGARALRRHARAARGGGEPCRVAEPWREPFPPYRLQQI